MREEPKERLVRPEIYEEGIEMSQDSVDAEALSLIIEKDQVYNKKVRHMTQEISNQYAATLFNAARAAQGINKARYAAALKKLRHFTSPTHYEAALKSLMTNSSTIEELIRQGNEEAGVVLRIKRYLNSNED